MTCITLDPKFKQDRAPESFFMIIIVILVRPQRHMFAYLDDPNLGSAAGASFNLEPVLFLTLPFLVFAFTCSILTSLMILMH